MATAQSAGIPLQAGGQTLSLAPSLVHIVGIPLLILSTVAVGFVLVFLQEILVPFVVALFFVYLLRPVVTFLTQDWEDCCRCSCRKRGRRSREYATLDEDEDAPIVDVIAASDEDFGRIQPEKKCGDLGMSPLQAMSSSDSEHDFMEGGGAGDETKRGTLSRRPQAAVAPDSDVSPHNVAAVDAGKEEEAQRLMADSPKAPPSTSGVRGGAPARQRQRQGAPPVLARCMRSVCCGASHCPRWIAVIVALGVAAACLAGLALMVADAAQTFESEDLDTFVDHARGMVKALMVSLQGWFRIDGSNLVQTIQDNLPITNIVHRIITTLFDVVGNAFLIMLFVLYLLFEQSSHPRGSLRAKIDDQIQRYIGLKTVVSAGVAMLVFVVLGPILHVKMAHLFAVLTFLFNYIPNVGPLVATMLPLPIVVLDPDLNPTSMFLAFALPTAIHAIVGNFLEPKMFGKSLELHPVTVLLALAFWFAIWGTPGAILSVPITAVIRIILSHISHPYARIIITVFEGRMGIPQPAGAAIPRGPILVQANVPRVAPQKANPPR